MVEHLNDTDVFEGKVVTKGELIAEGVLTIGVGGMAYGEGTESADSWEAIARVRVANVTERAAVVAWRNANAPITAMNPLLVWRADGSLTGVNELTLDGTNWYAETPLAGDVELSLAATAPYGWLFLQGQTLPNAATNYPALWAQASAVFRVGSDLKLPDMRGRVPIGAGQGTSLTLRNLGDVLGAENVQLSEAQMPSHFHTGETGSPDRSLNHTHNVQRGGTEASGDLPNTGKNLWYAGTGDAVATTFIASTADATAGSTLNHQHPFTTSSKGSSQAHPNMQPSAVLNFKVKV